MGKEHWEDTNEESRVEGLDKLEQSMLKVQWKNDVQWMRQCTVEEAMWMGMLLDGRLMF